MSAHKSTSLLSLSELLISIRLFLVLERSADLSRLILMRFFVWARTMARSNDRGNHAQRLHAGMDQDAVTHVSYTRALLKDKGLIREPRSIPRIRESRVASAGRGAMVNAFLTARASPGECGSGRLLRKTLPVIKFF